MSDVEKVNINVTGGAQTITLLQGEHRHTDRSSELRIVNLAIASIGEYLKQLAQGGNDDLNAEFLIVQYDLQGNFKILKDHALDIQTVLTGKVEPSGYARDMLINAGYYRPKELARHLKQTRRFIRPSSGKTVLVDIISGLQNFTAKVEQEFTKVDDGKGKINQDSVIQNIIHGPSENWGFVYQIPLIEGDPTLTDLEIDFEFKADGRDVTIQLSCFDLKYTLDELIRNTVLETFKGLAEVFPNVPYLVVNKLG